MSLYDKKACSYETGGVFFASGFNAFFVTCSDITISKAMRRGCGVWCCESLCGLFRGGHPAFV